MSDAGHDRAGRPREEEEGEEEDEADVVLEVRAHALAPGRREPAEAGEGVGAVVAVLRPPLLHAAVDVPAEVVEGRRHDGDGEDVLHRRRHDVLPSGNTRLVGHEAHVDEPHDHDGPEVELLRQDLRVERLPVLERLDLLLDCLGEHEHGRDHSAPSSRPLRGFVRKPTKRPPGVPCTEPPRLPPPCGGFLHTGA